MLLLAIISVCLLIVLLFVFYHCRHKKTVLLFIDAPDPDNPAAACALWKQLLKQQGHLHVVLTGRPVDLRTAKRFKEGVSISSQFPRQAWETSVQEHAEQLLEDSAARIATYLQKCGVPSTAFTVFNGMIAREAPLSDAAHDWDFLFDRKDLITGRKEDEGEILEPEEYAVLVKRYNSLSGKEREDCFLSLLRRYPLTPLAELCSLLNRPWCGNVQVFLGGPATALVEVFGQQSHLPEKVSRFYGMFGALNPGGSETLLPNQFNVACDLPAAKRAFVEDLFPTVDKYLVTTETSKQAVLMPSANEMAERGINPYIVKLHRLWESTHQKKPQPLFDVLPVMAAVPAYNNVFTWVRKTAVVDAWRQDCSEGIDVFCFLDSESSNLFVSGKCFNSDRETFMHFLASVWK